MIRFLMVKFNENHAVTVPHYVKLRMSGKEDYKTDLTRRTGLPMEQTFTHK